MSYGDTGTDVYVYWGDGGVSGQQLHVASHASSRNFAVSTDGSVCKAFVDGALVFSRVMSGAFSPGTKHGIVCYSNGVSIDNLKIRDIGPPPAAISDNFNRADGVLGAPWEYPGNAVSAYQWLIDTNHIRAAGASGYGIAYRKIGSLRPGQTLPIQADITANGSNYWFIDFLIGFTPASRGSFRIQGQNGGGSGVDICYEDTISGETILENVGGSIWTGQTLKITVFCDPSGAYHITVFRDGTQQGTTFNPTQRPSGSYLGLLGQTGTLFDNFSASIA
mgnify:CR=1 FL=1